jgi:hypothetical protein
LLSYIQLSVHWEIASNLLCLRVQKPGGFIAICQSLKKLLAEMARSAEIAKNFRPFYHDECGENGYTFSPLVKILLKNSKNDGENGDDMIPPALK